MAEELRATFEAAPNIALVKYWGQRDSARKLPYNSSLSVTLEGLVTRTTVEYDAAYSRDSLELNEADERGAPLRAVVAMLDHARRLARRKERAHVESTNDFPTASGLASSASGFAALAASSTEAAGVRLTPRKLSQLARLGSGSASRSIFGGFVEWRAGTRRDGADCYARPLFSPDHWPELRDLVVEVANAPTKDVRSSDAMQLTVATAPEYDDRLTQLPRRISTMRNAIRDRSSDDLFPLIMEECDSFRHVCETTTPTLDYLTSTSRAVLRRVLALNAESRRPVAAYTHDAGAHVHVFTLAKDSALVRRSLFRLPGISAIRALRPGPGVHRVDQRPRRRRAFGRALRAPVRPRRRGFTGT